jgi:hypothetical protein
MGWDISLKRGGEVVEVPAHTLGSNVAFGGSTVASTTITFNYSPLFRFSALDGLTGLESIDLLEYTYVRLGGGSKPDKNYWEASPGNVGYAALQLCKWARLHPDAVWEVT